jgi:hypothetical protein
LDQQAVRLNLSIEDFGSIAQKARNPVRIAGRCTVFAESDMIHKQQMGHSLPDIVAGLCEALVRNYQNNIGRGKRIEAPVVFQGGVAANLGIREAFRKSLHKEIIVPPHFNVMGAYGAALLAGDQINCGQGSRFRGFSVASLPLEPRSFDCQGCPNNCEVVEFRQEKEILARWGDRCGRWSAGSGPAERELQPHVSEHA